MPGLAFVPPSAGSRVLGCDAGVLRCLVPSPSEFSSPLFLAPGVAVSGRWREEGRRGAEDTFSLSLQAAGAPPSLRGAGRAGKAGVSRKI